MTPAEVPAIRRKIYEGPPCLIEVGHHWDELRYGKLTILILCLGCGRTPLEMLNQLEVQPRT